MQRPTPFKSWEAFCRAPRPFGLGRRAETIETEIQRRAALAQRTAGPGRGHKTDSVTTSFNGERGRAYILARLERDAATEPDKRELLERVPGKTGTASVRGRRDRHAHDETAAVVGVAGTAPLVGAGRVVWSGPLNAKRKGTRGEHRAIKLLEACGYVVTRSGGSLGVFDLVAIGPRDIRCVQVKCGSARLSAIEREAITGLMVPPNVSKEAWRFPDRARTPTIERL